jgi:stringent starvation protein B
MSEQSAKPYLVRAICEWCADNGLTPYLVVKVDAQTRVPRAYVRNGEIVLNISASATRKLTIDNEWVSFNARFSGASQEVSVPMAAVAGIFAKETGYGFAFAAPAADAATSLQSATESMSEGVDQELADDASRPVTSDKGDAPKPKGKPPHLQVIK